MKLGKPNCYAIYCMYYYPMNNEQNLNMFLAADQLAAMPAKQRLDAIFDHADPSALVQSLSSHNLLLTINDIGAQDCLELIELLSPKQVQDIFDLEIWQN